MPVWHPLFGWASCGGHVQLDEDPRVAALRELTEETRLDDASIQPMLRPLFVHRSDPGPDASHVHWNIAFGWTADERSAVTGEAGRPTAWFGVHALPRERAAGLDTGLAVVVALAET